VFAAGKSPFEYCHSNPITKVDPDGRYPEESERHISAPSFGSSAALGRLVSAVVETAFRLKVAERAAGAGRVAQAGGEFVAALTLAAAPEPTLATKVGAIAVAAHAADTLTAGVQQIWTGDGERTKTHQAVSHLAQGAGAAPGTADRIGAGVDLGLGVFGVAWGALRASTLSVQNVRGATVGKSAAEAVDSSRTAGGAPGAGFSHINIYGEAEALPRFLDYATEAEFANGRPVTASLESGSVTNLFIRSAPINSTTAAEMARLAAPGARIDVVLVEGSEGAHLRRLYDALGDRVEGLRVRNYIDKNEVPMLQTTVRVK
jgi:hypothetical protein